MPPVGKEGWPALQRGDAFFQRRSLLRGAPACRNTKNGGGRGRCKDNGAIWSPASTPAQRSICQRQDGTPGGFHCFQLARTKKADVSAIRRPEGEAGVFRPRERLCRR